MRDWPGFNSIKARFLELGTYIYIYYIYILYIQKIDTSIDT
jgi:hypothetical protein